MSELNEIIDSLESKFTRLVQKLDALEVENATLLRELNQSREKIKNLDEAYHGIETRYDSLKLANSLLGNDENKRDTKLKINSLIREIDNCIAQLSE
ncbi:hypothetical protein [Flavobacterium sp. JP2137]|uniref:hypothetical protein n=1 Tax=Flavobacterium sp. JP2137 TaxID=3414510 RepID=UPI003D2FAF86